MENSIEVVGALHGATGWLVSIYTLAFALAFCVGLVYLCGMNNDKKKFSWRRRAESFKYAFAGIVQLIKEEHNARIHCVVAIITIIAGFILSIQPHEWLAIAICIGAVLAAEGFNTAVEALADRITKESDNAIKKAKDVAAGAVLITAVAAVAVGLIIFVPKIIALL